MPRESGTSFRITHPDPLDFLHAGPISPEIRCLFEFRNTSDGRALSETLRHLLQVRQIRIVHRSPFALSCVLSWSQALALPKALKDFPALSGQVRSGVKAYGFEGPRTLKGRGNRSFKWSRRTQIMGILNVTPDSFSDGGRYLDPAAAVQQALQMQEAGADWIDIGGESTRPRAKAVNAQEEKKRILPVIKACSKALGIPVSVDTYKAEVAQAAITEGAQLVNDIGALALDRRMGKTLSRLKVPVILMHMRGRPRTMQKKPVYKDVVGEILVFFRERIDYALQCGIAEDRILLDPGFGFGKTPWHNIELIRRLWEFRVLGRPLVLGPSRKSTLGLLLGGVPPEKRVEATGAAVTAAILKGADWVRVHDVQSMVPVVKIADAIRYDRGLPAP